VIGIAISKPAKPGVPSFAVGAVHGLPPYVGQAPDGLSAS
jgi:hypothetical protein